MPHYLPAADLILTVDQAVYHLALHPHEVSSLILLVGDPDRVPQISKYFDSIEIKRQNREFVTHTGYYRNKRMSVISTGISTANIDIVLNELDALFNLDFTTMTRKSAPESLTLIRLGTAGGLQPFINLGSLVASETAISMSNLLLFYQQNNSSSELNMLEAFMQHTQLEQFHIYPTIADGDPTLLDIFSDITVSGITITCPGFYGPQGRYIRTPAHIKNLLHDIEHFNYQNKKICNLEMETGALYGLGKVLGHKCLSISTIVADRLTGQFSFDPIGNVEKMIQLVLEKISQTSI